GTWLLLLDYAPSDPEPVARLLGVSYESPVTGLIQPPPPAAGLDSLVVRLLDDGKRITNHTLPGSAGLSDPLLTFSTPTGPAGPFTTGFEAERIPEAVRLARAAGQGSTPRKGEPPMEDPQGHQPGDAGLVFAACNNHHERCGRPPRLRNTDNLRLYHGY